MPDNIVTIDFHRHVHIQPGEVVLDLGSGNGRHTIEACRWPCRVISVDVDKPELQRARFFLRAAPDDVAFGPYPRHEKPGTPGRAEFILADAQHLPFKDAAFDKVLCTEVLEHIPDDKAGIRELYRVAKPGADVAVSVPRYWPERVFWTLSWEYWHTPGGHVRMYRPGEMAGYLQANGFDVRKVRYRHAFQAFYWFLRCTFGKDSPSKFVPRSTMRFINWYHGVRPSLLERMEAVANLVAGKDMIHYTRKPLTAGRGDGAAARDRASHAGAPN